jgi:hypothetical protein
MNSDHANNEKKTAAMMEQWKHEEILQELGQEALTNKEVVEILTLCQQWHTQKIEGVGGLQAWKKLSPDEQAIRNIATINAMVQALGKEALDRLTDTEERTLKLFVWVGCGMHKDQNAFKAGCLAMNAAWKELGLEGHPIILANKSNAAAVRKALAPERGDAPLTETELAALEVSTFGGAKAAALAGTIYNNKDDKKGQGDLHTVHFDDLEHFRHFPQTHACRFGTFGEAAGELILHRNEYRQNMEIIRYRKQTASFTNLEYNVYMALDDIGTQTEWVIMSIYHECVTVPYLDFIRGSGSNALDLTKYYTDIVDHCQKAVDDPSLFLEKIDEGYVNARLDGKPWPRMEIMEANYERVAHLPNIVPLFKVFWAAAKGAWILFTSEYAPGGVIDAMSDDEKLLAWMSSTNDVNEGILGAYRVFLRLRPRTTLHQYNAIETFRRNETQDFVDSQFQEEDYQYVRKEARILDASKLETRRRREQKEFDLRVAQMRREREVEKARKIREELDRLGKVELISHIDEINAAGMTVAKLQDQLDVLKIVWKDTDIPLKSHIPKKADKQKALEEAFLRHQARVASLGNMLPEQPGLQSQPQIMEDWQSDEDEEMD